MNTANIKKYAPKARNNFIAAVTKQAARYGITAKGTEPMEQRGDIALIGEKAFPKAIAPARKALERMVDQMGFAQAMEQAAYSWFNRFCAIRYMEVHDFLDHGRRVLSTANSEAGTPQILDDCLDISLPGLDTQRVAELKLDGNKDEELYRQLLLAQCHALHEAMPFLFEAVDDATELLLPDNLTKTDSLIRELVSAIPEDDWKDVEIIGWLYQFYISEKKGQVIGKVVKSEDIPAATQLFTPNWIVQYLVQNSVGRQWLQTYPDSPLRNQMPYFIEPGEQPPEVQAQLTEIVPDAIDPESIKVLDPACGSGHILVEAYKILKAIYEERGYRSRDIPQQILKHNLFGLDIDDRAGQLAGFALMMLAREDDRRLFTRVAEGDVTLNVLSLKETGHLNLPQLWQDLNLSGDWQQGSSQSLFESEQADLSSASADERYQLLQRTLERFEEAKTFGSLIEVPEEDTASLKALVEELEQLARTGDVMQKPAAETLLPYVRQAWILAQQYDSVIANPPYMGSKGMNAPLKKYAKDVYPNNKSDLYAMFIERGFSFCKKAGFNSMITMHSWMFLSTYAGMRAGILRKHSFLSAIHLPYDGKGPTAMDLNFGVVAAIFNKTHIKKLDSYFDCYRYYELEADGTPKKYPSKNERNLRAKPDEFKKIPGSPIAYWVSKNIFEVFSEFCQFGDIARPRQGLATGCNEEFLRSWHELSLKDIGFGVKSRNESVESGKKWFPYNKGGEWRKWYGNCEYVVNWADDGKKIRNFKDEAGKVRSRPQNTEFYFQEGITWSDITTKSFGARYTPSGFIFDIKGSSGFPNKSKVEGVIGLMNSCLMNDFMKILNPTSTFQVGDLARVPFKVDISENNDLRDYVNTLIDIAKKDWDSYEESWDFLRSPLLELPGNDLRSIYSEAGSKWHESVMHVKRKEEEINKIFISEYGLQAEVTPEISLEEVTLTRNCYYRYGRNKSETQLEVLQQNDSVVELISYALGCMMGRYSLNKTGLILASQGEALHDYLRQIPSPRFAPDDDAILLLTDQEWFADDATNRFREFISVVWGDEHLQGNLDFVAESLCLHAIKPKRGESALDTIRRYLSTQFYKDHLRTYKKRPIYWLFSSGKHKAFECLVYLHRYNEGTLARMRTEYVIPLSAKLNAYAEKLDQDRDASNSAAETKRLEKEIATLHKQQAELAEFDEKLRHHADQRISLDLDDGVKVNYGKFGDLLAEVKAVTGEKPQ